MMNRIHFGKLAAISLKFLIGLVPKDRNLILFSAWFGKKFGENSGYEFEYMKEHSNYNVYWYTKDFSIYKELQEKGMPVIYSKSFKGIWYQIRAIMLVSAVQFEDYCKFLLKNCIYLDLDHGFPGKVCGVKIKKGVDAGETWYSFLKKDVDFYQTASSKFVVDILYPFYNVEPDHYIFSNKPRIDVFFDQRLQKGKNVLIDQIKNGRKAIVYLPTHRSSGKKEIILHDVFDLETIQQICEKENFVFIIKKHFFHRNEKEDLEKYPNIFDVTSENLDTQVLLAQTDVLVTDFSSCFIDFLAVDRPIIFYAFDYNDFLSRERDYYWKYEMITAGYTSKSKDEFNKAFRCVANDLKDSKHCEGRRVMREIYFDKDVEMGDSRNKIMQIITQLIEGKYIPHDWSAHESILYK